MATVTVTVQRNDHIADFNAIFSELGQAYMTIALNVVQGAVQRNAPVNTGQFRTSIANQVKVDQLQITGSVFSQDDPIKVAVLETGRGAGKKFPPLDVLRRWVELKLGANILADITTGPKAISKAAAKREAVRTSRSSFGPQNTPRNKAINRVTFLIGRKIAKMGIAGRHVFQKSFDETDPECQRILGQEFPAALAKRL